MSFCSIFVMHFAHFCCQGLSRKRVRTRLLLSHELRVQYVDGRHITQQVQATDGCSSMPTSTNHHPFTLHLLSSYPEPHRSEELTNALKTNSSSTNDAVPILYLFYFCTLFIGYCLSPLHTPDTLRERSRHYGIRGAAHADCR